MKEAKATVSTRAEPRRNTVNNTRDPLPTSQKQAPPFSTTILEWCNAEIDKNKFASDHDRYNKGHPSLHTIKNEPAKMGKQQTQQKAEQINKPDAVNTWKHEMDKQQTKQELEQKNTPDVAATSL